MSDTIFVHTFNDGQWGADTTDEQVAVIAENYADLADVVAQAWFPGQIEVQTTSEHRASEQSDETFAVLEYLSRHWTEEPLWQPEFDAAAYFAANPR